jgi:hypothetical protein
MKNLGKILLSFIVLQNIVYANVVASVDYNSVSLGETVTYMIEINGDDVQNPMVDSLCNTNVTSTASQTSMSMINGKYTKSKTLSYQFVPRSSCVIAPIDVVVDGKVQKTNSVNVEVKAPTQDLKADFIIELIANKTDLLVGEPFELSMFVKQRHGAQALDSKFIAPKMDGFWTKGEPTQQKYDDGAFTITKLTYRLSAQHAGELKISPAQLSVAFRSNSRDGWGFFTQDLKWKSYFSNNLTLSAKPLPKGATLVGDFTMRATVDKSQINQNEAVNLTIEIDGNGNLEDIEKFKPYIKDVSVFDEKPVIKGTKFREKLALVGDGNFTIPSFTLKFYNLKTKQIQEIKTQEIPIKVNGSKAKQELNIKRDKEAVSVTQPQEIVVHEKLSILWAVLIFIVGLVFGVALMLLKPWNMVKRKDSFNLKDEKRVLIKLLPYKDDADVKEIVDTLEHNIYSNEKKKLDMKKVKEIFKKFNIV